MVSVSSALLRRYHQPIWGRMDRALRNSFAGAAILGLAVLIAIFVVPTPPPEPLSFEQLPERFARLILEKPQPAAVVVSTPEPVAVGETPEVETLPEQIKPKPQARPKPRRRLDQPQVARDKGAQGRQKAQKEVTENLAQVTGSLDKVLSDLSKSLPAAEKPDTDSSTNKPGSRRRRSVRTGRSSRQLGSVRGVTSLTLADITSSAIQSKGISIAAITDLAVAGGGGGASDPVSRNSVSASSGRGGGEYRSNDSLLGVVRRYAPGIQFCYDNELKKNPGLRGKLVVSLSVLASGEVSEVLIVHDTLLSPAVTECVLSQIRGWKFPAIPSGVTTFKSPFVFTPPD